KLTGLDEKHILKRLARGLIPDEIIRRPKQPYRAPDARSFIESDAPGWVADVVSEREVADVGVFEPAAVARLWRKMHAAAGNGNHSNVDDMALVGVLSVGLLHDRLIRHAPQRSLLSNVRTKIDVVATENLEA